MSTIFKYKKGLIETYANPLNILQLNDIYSAASECEQLFIQLNDSIQNDSISYKLRYRWLCELTAQFPNVTVTVEKVNKTVDIKYTLKEEVIYKDTKITSKDIHENPFKYWELIPNIIKEYYVKKILIIGNESCGKSVLAQSLANLYNTEFISEYSREVCTSCGGEDFMLEEDFEKILYQHKLNIINGSKKANKLLFIDTDAFMTFYYRNQCNFNSSKEYILDNEEIIQKISRDYDLVLFLESDVPYVDDELRIVDRNINGLRQECSEKLKELYNKNGINFELISGNYKKRLKKAQKIINENFNL